ncbi:MAG TPA: flagellar hook assembly protein FlgD [Hyphomicrobiales bacterium]|nr:flagellar hook assembly protein FlgD [Hyphomicrobiales bacterium]
MIIDQLTGGGRAQGATTNKQELGQQDFLKLLVAQMKNQDPTNPTDNSEFLSQMAQFSMVSGIDKMNGAFQGIASGFYATQALQAATLVGREVLADTDTVLLEEGASVGGVIQVPELADGLNLQVRDATGKLVRTIMTTGFGSGSNDFRWDGNDEQGRAVAPGAYTVRATVLVEGEQLALPVQLYQRVESVAMDRAGTQVQLQLSNDARIGFSQVSQFR